MRERPSRTKPQVEEELRGLPRSPDAESGVLSAFLQNPAYIADFQENGKAEFFYHVGNRLLAEELFAMHAEGVAMDVVTVSQWLFDRQLMDKIGGPSLLAELLNFVPTPAHYPWHMGILQDKFALREALGLAGAMTRSCYDNEEDLKLVAENCLGHCAAMEALFRERDKPKTLADQIDAWQEEWTSKLNKEKTSAMPTRWPEFNLKMGGLNEGYTLIGGEYSSGKSVLMRNLMVDACVVRHQRPGIIFSYETTASDVISGMVCDIAGIPSEVAFRPDCSPPLAAHPKSIAHALEKIRGSKLQIIDNRHLSAEDIASKAKAIYDKEGDLVVAVDYLQKIPRPTYIEKNATQERELASNSDAMQKLSEKMPVIMAIQINKDGSSRGSESTMMDGDMALRIEGEKGIFITKFKKGARHFHLPLFLEHSKLRFIQGEPNLTFP